MINSINTNNKYNINNIGFKAIPIAKYGYLADKNVVVYQLEKKDISYVQHIIKHLESFYKKYDIDGESAKQVIEEALNAGIAILKDLKHHEKKARIFMAFCDNKPSSILIGNSLKVDKNGGYHYSSRKEHATGETELDWLATFNKEIPGEGQATVNEYFHTLIDDGFEDCFVRAELPQKSSAVNFYIRMGFKKLSNWARCILRTNDNGYDIGKYDNEADKIIPMLAKKADIKEKITEKDKELMRKEIINQSFYKLPKEFFD